MKRERQERATGVESTRHYFSFVYYQKLKELRARAGKGERKLETQIHKARDGFAFLELSSALEREGFRFGGIFFNPPAQVQEHLRERERFENRRILQPEEFLLANRDLLLLATRPAGTRCDFWGKTPD